MIRSWLLKRISFCIMIKWPAVIYLQSVELWGSVFFICLNRCQRVAKSIDIIVCTVSRVCKRENKNEGDAGYGILSMLDVVNLQCMY